MTAMYRLLLKLYPCRYRSVFGTEMLADFRDAQCDASHSGVRCCLVFYLREVLGLLTGAARERLLASQSVPCELNIGGTMTRPSRCRFPNSAIVMMTIVFLIVLEMIAKIQGVAHYFRAISVDGHISKSVRSWPSHYGLVSGIAVCFAVAWAVGLIAWAIAYATQRSGAQRFDQFQTWPQSQR
jgi:hypothetical protein